MEIAAGRNVREDIKQNFLAYIFIAAVEFHDSSAVWGPWIGYRLLEWGGCLDKHVLLFSKAKTAPINLQIPLRLEAEIN